MNPEPEHSRLDEADDRLMDSLLHELARLDGQCDEAFLKRLEEKLNQDAQADQNAHPMLKALTDKAADVAIPQTETSRTKTPWMAMAATVAIAMVGWFLIRNQNQRDILAVNDRPITHNELGQRLIPFSEVPKDPLPPELIEGTPKPINLPNLTDDMELRSRANMARGDAPPSPPSSHTSNVITQAGKSASSIPVPVEEVRMSSPSFGDELGFSRAWGEKKAVPASGGRPALPPQPQPAPVDRERYGILADNTWRSPADEIFSTFSVDVDTASYTNFRRMVTNGERIPADAIRLEEMVNYFDYAYPQPADDHPFGVGIDAAVCPWNPETRLVRVALQGKDVARPQRAPANLVFLLDVSGSMNAANKLPLVAKSFELLIEEMNDSDTITIVVYAGAEGLALPPTRCDSTGRQKIVAALANLRAGGSTNGGAGINLAYKMAKENFKPGGINRVILATDGDFNVGVTEDGGLVSMVEKQAKAGVFLTVLGFGVGNLNDGMLEAITNKGNGTYHYIDSIEEGRRVFLQKMMGTLVTIAKDVKVQVEFNPAQVSEYRLLGYANRMLKKEDFNNDRVDAGDIGAGHTVTAFYEIKPGAARAKVDPPRYADPEHRPTTVTPATSSEWLTVKLRYKQPDGDSSTRIDKPFTGKVAAFKDMPDDFRFATSVAMTASLLRETEGFASANLQTAREMAAGAIGTDPHGQRAEFVRLLNKLVSDQHDAPR